MSRGQARAIIALLGVIVVLAVAGFGAWLLWGRSGDDGPVGAAEVRDDEVTEETAGEPSAEAVDSVALLEGAGVDSVNPAPVPEAVDSWGDYEVYRSWSGTLRVFENNDPSPVSDDGGGRFPATMNGCGVAMYLVTFRSVNEDVVLDAQLLNAADTVSTSETLSDGWMLTTNCQTPQFAFNSSSGISNLGDVAYDITEYRQSSVAAPAAAEQPVEEPVVEEPVSAEPTLVQCDNGLSIMGLYSDGEWRTTQECDTPEHRRAAQAEGVCGGLNGREEQPELWAELCQ
ncbi:hypothetical protein PQI66_13410 [Corynebacterium sp. USCH3]|uniref:hypothetical protein n=1 Tax=Corynebacterium sp. USCH3 TaxID=3024840 RepID=UPI0030B116F7